MGLGFLRTGLFCAGLLSLTLASCSPKTPSSDISAPSNITVYSAKNIITVNPDMPIAQAVAIDKGGRIAGLGTLAELKAVHEGASIDRRFEDKTITPGLIDPHVHMTLGAMMYGLDFVPPWDMETPKGTVKGLPNKSALLAKIAEFEATALDGPLFLYGYHNLVQGDLTRQDLDEISTTRPIFIWHYSGHDFYLNSAAIDWAKLTPALADKYHGIGLDENGALNAGVTTVAEMGYGIFGRALEDHYINTYYTDEDNYNLYLVPEHRAFTQEFGAQALAKMQEMSADKTRNPPVLNQVKLFTDAAFYSQTMKMSGLTLAILADNPKARPGFGLHSQMI